ncbi:alpha-amylase family protein [Segetibacter koreensis]|uniref:alpha-amylase family protein n=1 Tax=Segetibacter koreensis TaxID=398037 RepID=UPI00035CEB35|nr:beta-galactosidase [Segetibacter koreensis]
MDNPKHENSNKGRRSFLKQTAVTAAMLATTDFVSFAANNTTSAAMRADKVPWYKRITRWGQINITEKDPGQYDIGWWRKFWKQTNTEGVIVNAGGIVAYYPTLIPLHHKAEYLQGRDLFGELSRAAHEDGIAVFARMDSNRAHEEFYQAHPDWFSIDANGKPYKAADLYISCVNSPYYEEYIPSILTEIATMYHPEGFTDNSWSGLGRESICYCENCKRSFRDKTGKNIPSKNWDDKVYKQWIRWNYDRRLEIWDLNNRTTKAAGGVNCIWSGMNSGSISGQSRSFRDYKEIARRADIIMLDDQSRSDATGFQHNGEIGKLVHGMLGWEKLAPESMAMYQHQRPWFRLSSKPQAEARMWMLNGIAGGIQPWWHMISAYHEDRRMYHTPGPVLQWYNVNESYLLNRKPIANIGVVWSQQNTDFYGRDDVGELVDLPWRGMIQALVRSRIPHLVVHADHIDRDAAQFSVLALPNLALMTDEQLAAVRRFVDRGGSLIATGDTSLFDEWGDPRSDYALADLFGAHLVTSPTSKKGAGMEKMAGEAYHTYLRLTPELRGQMEGPHTLNEPVITGKRHPIFKGFEETDILPYGGLLEPLKIDNDAEVLMTFIPQFPTYPPEKAYMREPKTDIPGVIINTRTNGSRIIFIPADIDRQFGRFNLPDHGDLLRNIVRWAAKEDIPLDVEGAGLVDCHLYSQQNKLILHVVNVTSAATWRQPLDELIAIGPLKVRIKLPGKVGGGKVRSLVTAQSISANVSKGWCQFEIKSILDHEVIVVS